jgi:catechol 2,3-dioxygenase-like lactoylglutathione lyase family enzyme
MLLGIDHIELIVTDLEESSGFFAAMGFEVVRKTPHHGGSAELKPAGDGQPVFEIHAVVGREVPGINHIAFPGRRRREVPPGAERPWNRL